MDNINKGMKIFICSIIVIVLSNCSAQNKFPKINNIVQWQNEQFKYTNNLIEDNPNDFISLGFGSGKEIETARKEAEFEAKIHLPAVREIFIESVTMVYDEYVSSGNNNSEISVMNQCVSGKSNFRIKANEIKYEEIDYRFFDGEFCVAMNAIVSKEDYYKDYMNHVSFSKSEKVIEFDKQVRKKFKELRLEKEKLKNQ